MLLSWPHADQETVSYSPGTAISQHSLLQSLQASVYTYCLDTGRYTIPPLHVNLCSASSLHSARHSAFLPSLAQLTLIGYMSGCDTTYVQPERDTQLGVAHGVCPDSLQHTLEAATAAGKQVKAVLVVSPTYFGAVSDIKGQFC